MGIVYQLMDGYGALIIVDASNAELHLLLVPDVPDLMEPTLEEWQAQIADLHWRSPHASFVLPVQEVLAERVLIVGCQPETCEEFEEGLSVTSPQPFRRDTSSAGARRRAPLGVEVTAA
ncbi:MAG: hypothetical protein KY431_08280 [Actinobacteria bacterium]|nr:hypothetical protein [Actinomycetota bacterium]